MLKIFISIIGVILTFIGYVPYIRDVLKNKTTPHAFTWFIYTLVGFIALALQIKGGAGVGYWTLLAADIFCLIIFILSLKFGTKDITISDVFFLILAFISLYLWLAINKPVWSVILATTTEILGFAPTIRKSWNNPNSETLFLYQTSALRQLLSIFSLQKINILTALYPFAWAVANGVFSLILVIRRKNKF